MTKRNKQIVLFVSIAAITALLIYLGFNTQMYKTELCTSTQTVKMVAEFSDTTMVVDYDGNAYPKTDYWSEDASMTYYVEMVNHTIVGTNAVYHTVSGIAYPLDTFDYSKSAKQDLGFDRFKLKKSSTIHQHISGNDYVSISRSQYMSCIENIGKWVKVRKWYMFAYGI